MSYPTDWPAPGKMHFRLVNERLGTLDLDCDHGYVVVSYDLGFPAVREVVYPNSMDDGTFDTTRFYGSRAITLDIALKPHSGINRQSPFLAAEAVLRDRLLAYCYPGIRSALIVSEHEDHRVKQTLVRGAQSSIAVARQNYNHVSLSLVAPRGAFLSWDRRCYPYSFSAATPDTQTLTIVNEGTAPAHWVATLSGESVKPRIILDKGLATEQVLQLDYSTALGDEIVIDSFSRTVLINGAATGFAYIDDNADWFLVQPGTSELTIEQDTYTAEGYPYAFWQPTANVHRDNFTRADGAIGGDWVLPLARPSTNIAQSLSIVDNQVVAPRDAGTGTSEARGYGRINRAITGQQHYIEFQVDNFYQWPTEGAPGAVLPLINADVEGFVRMSAADRSAVTLKVVYDVLNHKMDWSVFRYDTAGVKQANVISGSVPWPIEARNRNARWRLEITTGNVAKVLLNGKQQGVTGTVTSAPAGTYTGVSLHWRANDVTNGTPPRLNFVEAGGDTALGTAWQTAPTTTNWTGPGDRHETPQVVVLDSPMSALTGWTTTGTAPTIGPGRSGNGFVFSAVGAATYTIAAPSRSDYVAIRVAMKVTTVAAAAGLIRLLADAGATTHLSLAVGAGGTLLLQRGTATTLITAPAATIVAGQWVNIEVKARLHDTLGTAELRVNGALIGTFAGDTRNAGTNTVIEALSVEYNAAVGVTTYDDVFIATGPNAAFDGPAENPAPAGAPPWAWTTAVDPETGLPGALEISFCYYDQFV